MPIDDGIGKPFDDGIGKKGGTTMGHMRALDGLNRLQEFLLAMAIGDQLSAKRASEISGLDCKRCEALLDALMRAGVMMHLRHDTYVRCRLEPIGRQFDSAAEPPVKDAKVSGLLGGRV